MSTDYDAEVQQAMAPYIEAICRAAPNLTAHEVICAANVLRDLEEDPFNCKDYKSIAIAINEVIGE